MIKAHINADGKYPVNRGRIRALVTKFLDSKRITGDVQVSISIVGDRKMKLLNEKYKSHIGTTDVLSFPYSALDPITHTKGFVFPSDEGMILGDIIVSYPEARKRAMKRGKLVDDVIDFLIEHGLKHLTGEHHK